MFSHHSSIGEFFLLREAERTIRGYSPGQHEIVASHRAAADLRRRAARKTADPVAACVLFREALLAYLRAQLIAEVASTVAEAQPPDRLASRIVSAGADAIAPDREADLERVRHAVGTSHPLYFDRLERIELERTRSALERAVSKLAAGVEARTLVHVRASRWGRAAGTALLIAFVTYRTVSAVYWPDLAYGKPVSASSVYPNKPDMSGLVDGEIGTSYGAATDTGTDPGWRSICRPFTASRPSMSTTEWTGWFDVSLPLTLQISVDGVTFRDVARRDTVFDRWIVHLNHERARFVRVRSAGRTLLALSELEVFGDRQKAK